MYDREVASPVITIIIVPFHTQQLNRCPRKKETECEACPLRLLIPEIKPYTVDHWHAHKQQTCRCNWQKNSDPEFRCQIDKSASERPGLRCTSHYSQCTCEDTMSSKEHRVRVRESEESESIYVFLKWMTFWFNRPNTTFSYLIVT